MYLRFFPSPCTHERITCGTIGRHGPVRRKRGLHRRSVRTVPEGSGRGRAWLGAVISEACGAPRRRRPLTAQSASACVAARAAALRAGRGARRSRRYRRGAAGAKQGAVSRLIQVYANRGHLIASLDPLGLAAAGQALRPRSRVFRARRRGPGDRVLHRQPQSGDPRARQAPGHPCDAEIRLHRHASARNSRTCRIPTSGCGCRINSSRRACSGASAPTRRRTFSGS